MSVTDPAPLSTPYWFTCPECGQEDACVTPRGKPIFGCHDARARLSQDYNDQHRKADQ